MTEFLSTLGRLTAARKPRHRLKEVGIGLVVGVLIGVGTALSPEWAFWVLLLYFASVHAVALTENEVFCDFRDFRRLGFREPTVAYRLAYVVHYVARDLYVANTIALALGSAIMIAVGKPWFALALLVLVLVNLAVLPSHVHLAFRLSARGTVAYIAALFVAVIALALPLALGVRIPPTLEPLLGVVLIAVGALHVLLVDRVASRLRGTGLSSFGGRRVFAWLRPAAPHLFKDLLLFHPLALQGLFIGLSLFAILVVGSAAGSVGALLLLALCHDNLFLARRAGAYRVLSEDTLFHEDRLPADRVLLRRTKLTTLAVDLPVKLAIAAVVMTAFGVFRLDQWLLMAAVLVTCFVVDAPLPYLNERIAVWLRYVSTYTPIILFMVVVSFDLPVVLVGLHCLVVTALHLPTFVTTYVRRSQPTRPPTSASAPAAAPRLPAVTTAAV